MNQPFFSIIVPAYNVEAYLSQALDSVISQTWKDFEICLVEDKSTDSTLDIAKSYEKKYSNINLYTNKQNIGLASTRNVALENAKGRWIVFLDSDDIFEDKDFLKKLYTYCKDADCIYYGCSLFIEKENKIIRQNIDDIEKLNESSNLAKAIEYISSTGNLYHNIFRIAINRKFLVNNSLEFDGSLRQAEDLDLFYRILMSNPRLKTFNSNQYMWRQDNATSLTKSHKEQLKYSNQVFNKFYYLIFNNSEKDILASTILKCIGAEYTSFLIDCYKTFGKEKFMDEITNLKNLNKFLNYGNDKKTILIKNLSLIFGIKKAMTIYAKLKSL